MYCSFPVFENLIKGQTQCWTRMTPTLLMMHFTRTFLHKKSNKCVLLDGHHELNGSIQSSLDSARIETDLALCGKYATGRPPNSSSSTTLLMNRVYFYTQIKMVKNHRLSHFLGLNRSGFSSSSMPTLVSRRISRQRGKTFEKPWSSWSL